VADLATRHNCLHPRLLQRSHLHLRCGLGNRPPTD
jgi:hypothetical protein